MVRSSNYYELYIEYQEITKRAFASNLIKPWQKFVPKGYNCPVCMCGMFEVGEYLQENYRRSTVLIKFDFEALERLLDSRYHGQGTPEQSPAAYIFEGSSAPEDPK